MSLVNDVLRDLQTRQTHAAHPLQGLRPTANNRRRRRGLGVAAMSALVVLGLSAWRMADVHQPHAVVAPAHVPGDPVSVAGPMDDQTRPEGLRLASVGDFAGSRRAQPAVPVTRTRPQVSPSLAVSARPGHGPEWSRLAPDVAPAPDRRPASAGSADSAGRATEAASPAPDTATHRATAQTTAAENPMASVGPTPERTDLESAVAQPMKIRSSPPADPAQTAFRRGVAALAAGDARTAAAALTTAVGFAPARTVAWQHLATAHQSAGQPERAVAVLREALPVADDPDTLRLLLARLLVDAGRSEAALAALDPAIATPSRHPAMAGFRAALLQRAGRHAESADLYETLVAMGPGEGAWWMGLAISRESLGETGAALTAYRRAAELTDLPAPLADYAGQRIAGLSNPSH